MRIVICDDETGTCSELEQIIIQYARQRKIQAQIDIFYTGQRLLDYLNRNDADILFLDIELPEKNGVDVGKYIRYTMENERLILIYISSKRKYAMELFQNRPFDFIMKPLCSEKIQDILDIICRLREKDNDCFRIKDKTYEYRVAYKDILYFQSEGHKIHLITRQNTRTFYGKLNEVEKQCPEHLFLRIHNSYLVNIRHIEEITYEWVKLINGTVLDISRPKRVEIRRKLLEYNTNGTHRN